MTAKGEANRFSIDPSLINPSEKEILEDLLVAAINNAKESADALSKEKLSEATGDIALPGGMKLPF